MAQIIVIADHPTETGDSAVMWRERINPADFESTHFTAQLVERLGWAVEDAERDQHREASRVTTAS